jgi:hypothetical protein
MDAIFQMYSDIAIGKNEICADCIRKAIGAPLSKPISFWTVGNKFTDDPFKVLFVGKTARGNPGVDHGKGYLDARTVGTDLFFSSAWHYWSYTNEIVRRLYKSEAEGWQRIAFTNLVKCNNSSASDNTPPERMHNCLSRLGVFRREVEILKPKRIVFYTHWDYDEYIASFRYGETYSDVTARSATRPNGKRAIPWWHRQFYSEGRVVMEFLRTSHPERKSKEEYVSDIVGWISKDKSSN